MAVSLTILIVALVCVCLYLIFYFTSSTSNGSPAPSTIQIPNTQNITASTTTSTNTMTSSSTPSQSSPTSGQLGIKVLKPGSGAAAKTGDTLSVLYTGKFTNGKVFDASSLHGNQPYSLTLGVTSVIQGWTQGLVGAQAGEELELTVPPQLGYGANDYPPGSNPPTIPGNSTLIFDITVLKIN